MAKYLDQSGVAYLWKKIDNKYATQESVSGLSASTMSIQESLTAVSGKVDGIEAGAQVNIIETVKVNGTALSVSAKTVDVSVPVLGVKSGEKVISLDSNKELSTTLTLHIESGSATSGSTDRAYIVLKGINGDEVSRIDASQFVVDGMLSGVTYDSTEHTMTFIWNTDAGHQETTIDLDDVIAPYTAGSGITIENNVVTAKLSANQQNNMSIVFDGSDNGLKVSGLDQLTNDKQVKGLSTGTVAQDIVVWGADGYTVADGGLKIADLATTAVTEAITGQVSELSGSVGTIATTYVKSVNGHTGNTVSVTKSDVGLGDVDNVKQIAGLSAGTTENHVVVWGADGYTVKDSSYTIQTSVPSGGVFTDTHVTSAADHYKQNEAGAGTKSDMVAASGTQVDITSGSVQVVTGLKLDAAGHVDSLICKEVKVDATKDEYLSYAEIDAAITYAEGNNLPYSQPINFNA